MQNQLIYTWANAVKVCLRYLKFFVKTERLHFYLVVLADYVSTWRRLILILNLFSQQDVLSVAALDPSLLFIRVFSDAAVLIQRCWGFALHDQSSFNENSTAVFDTVKNNAHVRHFASESFPADLKESFAQKKVVFSLFDSLPDDPFNLEWHFTCDHSVRNSCVQTNLSIHWERSPPALLNS